MKKLAVLAISLMTMLCLSVTAFADYGGGSGGSVSAGAVVGGIIVGIIVAVVVMMVHKGKLKSVKMQHAAANYIKQGSMKVTEAREIYLYKKVDRTEKPRDKD